MEAFLDQVHVLPDAVKGEFIAHFEPVSFKRKEIITSEGQVERYMYYVMTGVQRSYYLKDGKSHTIAFTYPPSFSGIPDSFLGQRPANCFLECITASEMLRISYDSLQKLIVEYREIETLMRKTTELVLIGLLERQYELLALNMEGRFRAFTKRSPHLLNLVPHKHIASYLRIDPTNFSKLLNSITI